MAGAEDADDEDKQTGNVPLSLLPLAGVVIPQTRHLEHDFSNLDFKLRGAEM